jgi:hypothetical protein
MKSALFPLSVRRVVGRLSGLLSVLLLVCVLAPAASGCTGAQKSGILTVRDDARGRTKRLDPRNQLSGTTKTNPAWANPGTYFYDDNSTVFFVELKVQSNNVPMKLPPPDPYRVRPLPINGMGVGLPPPSPACRERGAGGGMGLGLEPWIYALPVAFFQEGRLLQRSHHAATFAWLVIGPPSLQANRYSM